MILAKGRRDGRGAAFRQCSELAALRREISHSASAQPDERLTRREGRKAPDRSAACREQQMAEAAIRP